jgi:hypothetical protein
MKRFTPILLVLAVLLLMTAPILAQESVGLTFAAVHDHNVWLYGYNVEPQQLTNGSAMDYTNLVWSADKNLLAFVAVSEDFSADLWLYNRGEGSLRQVDSDVFATYPPSFDNENSQIIYFKDLTPPGAAEANLVTLFSGDLTGDHAATQFGTVNLGGDCGGGSSFPTDWLYWNETGGLGGFHSVLASTFVGIVYSTDCGYSTAVLDRATHAEVSLGNISRVALSPDQTKLAAITYLPGDRSSEQLVIIELATYTTTVVETAETPDQVTWGADRSNELFYSTRRMTDRAPEFSSAERTRLDAVLDNQEQLYLREVSIHHVDLNNSVDTAIYQAEAYAIGKITPMSGAILFGQVANAKDWFAEVAAGRLDNSDPVQYQQSENLVPVLLFRLPFTGELELLGDDLHKVAALTP